MALNIHVVRTKRVNGVEHVIEKESVASSSGSPTLEDYIEAEAALDYMPSFQRGNVLVTTDVGSMNAAS